MAASDYTAPPSPRFPQLHQGTTIHTLLCLVDDVLAHPLPPAPRIVLDVCQHVYSDGVECGSPAEIFDARSEQDFCWTHSQGVRRG